MLLPSGNPFKCHEEVSYLQSMIPPRRFDIFFPDWGMLRRSRRVLIFLLNENHVEVLSLQPMKQYIITTPLDDVLHCFCFVFAFCLVFLHGD